MYGVTQSHITPDNMSAPTGCGHANVLIETNHPCSVSTLQFIFWKRIVAIPRAQTLKTLYWTPKAENRSASVLLSPHKQTSLFLKLHLAWWIPQWLSYCVKWYEPNKKINFQNHSRRRELDLRTVSNKRQQFCGINGIVVLLPRCYCLEMDFNLYPAFIQSLDLD